MNIRPPAGTLTCYVLAGVDGEAELPDDELLSVLGVVVVDDEELDEEESPLCAPFL
jgi:hypothetical protein